MTALRAVRPNRACEARSSSPMYASTSTIRPTRRRRRRAIVADAAAPPSRAPDATLERSAGAPGAARQPARPAVDVGRVDVERLDVLRDQQPEDRGRSPGSAASGRARPSPTWSRRRRSCAGTGARRRSAGIAGIRKNESRMTITQPTRNSAWTTPRRPPMISSANVAFWNSGLLVVEALDHERERDRRRHEDDPEAEHDRVLVRELVPVRRRGSRPSGVAQVRREQEREEHRARGRAAAGSSPGRSRGRTCRTANRRTSRSNRLIELRKSPMSTHAPQNATPDARTGDVSRLRVAARNSAPQQDSGPDPAADRRRAPAVIARDRGVDLGVGRASGPAPGTTAARRGSSRRPRAGAPR